MKKNLTSISLLLIIAMFFCACSNTQSNELDEPLNQYLVTKSIGLTCTMNNLAQSDEYLSLLSSSPEVREFITELGFAEYTSPSKAVLIMISDEYEESLNRRNDC